MIAQIAYFDGPRSPEVVAASDRAGRDRITPAVSADRELSAGHRGTFVLRQPDGTQLVIWLADSAATLDRGEAILAATPLLPGEDPALLTGPERFERYEVVAAYDVDYQELAKA
ncbi:MAG: hypothetical protein ACR2FU_04145 [Streptosporangiaceae bacterium]